MVGLFGHDKGDPQAVRQGLNEYSKKSRTQCTVEEVRQVFNRQASKDRGRWLEVVANKFVFATLQSLVDHAAAECKTGEKEQPAKQRVPKAPEGASSHKAKER
eukprot:5978221-Lingulodinium_polyedra.AAC.1